MSGRFSPGDHLQARRRLPYYHHGIYVSDDRVIQFGSGITLLDKSRTQFDALSLEEFEDGVAAEVVQHGRDSWFTGHHPAADQPWKIVERAEFLLKLQPRLPYNLIGHNCEHIANMCVSGGWTESYQARRYFTVRVFADLMLSLWISNRVRNKLPIPGWVLPVVIGGFLLSIGVKTTYDDQIRRFWDEIREDWFANERRLAEDPRNGLTE